MYSNKYLILSIEAIHPAWLEVARQRVRAVTPGVYTT